MYKILDNKIVDSSFALYKNQRDEKDALSDRIARLETKQAVADAVEPWRNQVLQMQIAGETANRQFAEQTLVNYMNNMFYPVSVSSITIGSGSTSKSTYNPLLITPIAPSITI